MIKAIMKPVKRCGECGRLNRQCAKKPYSVPIGPYKWKVLFCGANEISGYYGTTEEQLIKLRDDMEPTRSLEVKLHEYIHAIAATYGLWDSGSDEDDAADRKREEQIVCTLAVGLAQILKSRRLTGDDV